MLTFILIGGLVWLAMALVFVVALAAAARAQVSPVVETELIEVTSRQSESLPVGDGGDDMLPAESPVPT
jgi:hypothetical protein